MGLLGIKLGGLGGGLAGQAIAKKLGAGAEGQAAGKEAGKILGEFGGTFLPYKNGGRVVKKTQKALLHKGEIVVPAKYAKHVSKTLKDKIKKNGGHNM